MSSYQPRNLDGRIKLIERPSGDHNSGGYGDVLSGSYVEEDEITKEVAIKIVRPRASKPDSVIPKKLKIQDRGPRREIRLWKFLVHPNIVPLLGLTTDFNHLNPFFSTRPVFPGMVSPWMKNGNLGAYSKQDHLEIADLLKLANVLIDDNRIACLTDFGLSTLRAGFENPSYWTSTVGGAIRWRAPELLPPFDWVATVPYPAVLNTAYRTTGPLALTAAQFVMADTIKGLLGASAILQYRTRTLYHDGAVQAKRSTTPLRFDQSKADR
ncbi:hypothetical protein HWV62_8006 [Athelia sp. TMB]|nr:hypothetical protein HWV62_8006 [Athelia sp. TMB]